MEIGVTADGCGVSLGGAVLKLIVPMDAQRYEHSKGHSVDAFSE